MNYKGVFSIIGKTMLIEAFLMLIPAFVGIIYQENNFLSFLWPILILIAIGLPLTFLKSKENAIYAKEGFVIVALTWIILSLMGALPFYFSGQITNIIDAIFETVSGFTTTGASILTGEQIDNMSKAHMFWRIFTHWIGGMGILVFVLAIIPANNAGVMHVFRTESPGPSVGKLVSKLRFTARVLYGIYMALTVIEIIFLLCGGHSFYDSLLLSFSTAGTGGFGVRSDSAMSYNSYTLIVLSVFMFLFSLNFNVYFLLLIGNFKKAFGIEEIKVFVTMIIVAITVVSLNLYFSMSEVYKTFGEALKHSVFQVTSIGSTTGLVSADFDKWPELSKGILIILTIIGTCGGSTGGGIKMSRIIILTKSSSTEFKKLLHPRAVVSSKFEGVAIDTNTERNVRNYLIIWIVIVIASTLLLALDGYADLYSDFTATLACIGNVGPGFKAVGPTLSYAGYGSISKILLSFIMLVGRLEIFPMLILFAPRTWKRG